MACLLPFMMSLTNDIVLIDTLTQEVQYIRCLFWFICSGVYVIKFLDEWKLDQLGCQLYLWFSSCVCISIEILGHGLNMLYCTPPHTDKHITIVSDWTNYLCNIHMVDILFEEYYSELNENVPYNYLVVKGGRGGCK